MRFVQRRGQRRARDLSRLRQGQDVIDLCEGILTEFAERSHPSTRQHDGHFVERSRPAWPVVQLGAPNASSCYETHRKIAGHVARRRTARRSVLWLPT